ncbi:MAG TPA: PEGA domain-containing protein, partial [Polyangiaceae bacterium]|nr:PEGA domain-containing protein [Polyangiaceae bacterium]
MTPSAPPPPPAATKPATPGVAVDMDWDDDDEATHIFDEEKAQADEATHIFDEDDDRTKALSGPLPAAGAPPPATPPPPPSPMGGLAARPKATLLGLTAPSVPPPPPPTLSRPPGRPTPPPPPPGRSSFPPGQGVSGFPPPPNINPLLPPSAPTQPGLGLGMGLPGRSGPPPMGLPGIPSTLPRPPAVPTYAPQARTMEATAMLRPQNRMGLWLVVALAVVGIVVATVMWTSSSSSRILVNVIDAKGAMVNRVDTFVDGRKVCDTSPCPVPDVAAGTHEVKILADGFDAPVVQTINVESRKDFPLSITLAQSSKGAGIRVSGTQGGVKLYVDDKEMGPLPQEVHDLSP